jgi:predicted ATPase
MAHISNFGVGNFRVFENLQQFKFSPITILTGTNSSGKSSLTKALLLMKSMKLRVDFDYEKKELKGGIELKDADLTNFNDLQIGNFNTWKNSKAKNDIITFELPTKLPNSFSEAKFVFEYKLNENLNKGATLHKLELIVESEKIMGYDNRDCYLGNKLATPVLYSYFRNQEIEKVVAFSYTKAKNNKFYLNIDFKYLLEHFYFNEYVEDAYDFGKGVEVLGDLAYIRQNARNNTFLNLKAIKEIHGPTFGFDENLIFEEFEKEIELLNMKFKIFYLDNNSIKEFDTFIAKENMYGSRLNDQKGDLNEKYFVKGFSKIKNNIILYPTLFKYTQIAMYNYSQIMQKLDKYSDENLVNENNLDSAEIKLINNWSIENYSYFHRQFFNKISNSKINEYIERFELFKDEIKKDGLEFANELILENELKVLGKLKIHNLGQKTEINECIKDFADFFSGDEEFYKNNYKGDEVKRIDWKEEEIKNLPEDKKNLYYLYFKDINSFDENGETTEDFQKMVQYNIHKYLDEQIPFPEPNLYLDNFASVKDWLGVENNKVLMHLWQYEDAILPEATHTEVKADNSDLSLKDNLFSQPIKELFGFANKSIAIAFQKMSSILDSIDYIPSVRNVVQRNYNNGTSENYFTKLLNQLQQSKFKQEAKDFLNKYVVEFEIADAIEIYLIDDGSITKIDLVKNNQPLNLADVGYGISQLLPILLRIAIYINSACPDYKINSCILIIEEPETNLHPALQSKLADLFTDCYKKYNIQFILETHSEYLIRKMQFLTAKNEISPSDTQLYYFNSPNKITEGQEQVFEININQSGQLSRDFGAGFFDEADNIALELFLLRQNQKN